MGEVIPQHYCLRWNNHKSNFVLAFEQLFAIEAFTDVTVAGYDGPAIKCHKMVLAACSAYFQELFMKNPCEHPIIILSNVKHIELRSILNYMYKGEVNVERNELDELLKVATFLKVKGLARDSQVKCEEPDNSISPSPTIGNSTTSSVAHSSGYISPNHLPAAASSFLNCSSTGGSGSAGVANSSSIINNGTTTTTTTTSSSSSSSSAVISNNNNNTSSSNNNHHHNGKSLLESASSHIPYWAAFPGMTKPSHHIYGDSKSLPEAPHLVHHQPQHPVLSSTYENLTESSPLTKKKHSSHLHSNAILRSVLADSSQPMSIDHQQSELGLELAYSNATSSNGLLRDADRRNSAEMSEDERRNNTSPRNSYHAPGSNGHRSGNGGGSSSTRPEWKRYKQYTRENIMDAMTAVREKKMSALQAARQYKVPSRTLYDKLKKAGILPSRSSAPRGISSVQTVASGIESSACFPYPSGVNGSIYGNRPSAICSDAMSEHDVDMNGYSSDNGYGRDNDLTGSSSVGGDNESHDEVMDMSRRTPSPPPTALLMAQQHQQQLVAAADLSMEDEVEDLSVNRTPRLEAGSLNDVSVIVPTVKNLGLKKEEEPANDDTLARV